MKIIKGTFSFLYKCFACYTLVVYALLFWVPFNGWFAGFVMMTFPIVFAVHVLFLLISLFGTRENILLPLALVIAGCVFFPRTFGIHSPGENTAGTKNKTFKVMSYNVYVFQEGKNWRQEDVKKDINAMKNWISTSGADIVCMPEYYNYDDREVFRVNKHFKDKGFKYRAYLNQSERNTPENYWGLAVFSRYPIISMMDTHFVFQNGMVRTDVKIGKDTVRIVALHLFSMTLKLESLNKQRTAKGIWEMGKENLQLIKKGFTNHAEEMDILESWIKSSPYPIVVCGDFNETPYSYVYGKARSLLRNAFEEKGNGFGFTFNHLPYFIRIDHQFYSSESLDLIDFKTYNSVRFSDHYPITGTYQIKESVQKEE